jgi:hypothetical protein
MSNARFGLRVRSGSVGSIIQGLTANDLLLNVYPFANGAYSLRRLRQEYSGNAIRVRRSSDNTELDIGFNGNVLDTSTLLSFVGGGNGFVSIWYDQTANGYNATQVALANQPQIVSSGVVWTYNGKPALLIDGVNDDFNIPTLPASTRLDSYFVIRPTKTTYLYPWQSSNLFGFVAVIGNPNATLTGIYGTPQLYSNDILFTGTTRGNVQTFLDKYAINVHQNASIATWGTGYKLFGYPSFNFGGDVQEIILFANDQSSNRIGIQSLLNNYYNVY